MIFYICVQIQSKTAHANQAPLATSCNKLSLSDKQLLLLFYIFMIFSAFQRRYVVTAVIRFTIMILILTYIFAFE